MLDKASKFIFFTVFIKHGHSTFPILSFGCFALRKRSDSIPSKSSLRSILNLPKHQKSISHMYIAARVCGCRSENFSTHKFNVFTTIFTRLIMKTFKGVVFASIVFDV